MAGLPDGRQTEPLCAIRRFIVVKLKVTKSLMANQVCHDKNIVMPDPDQASLINVIESHLSMIG